MRLSNIRLGFACNSSSSHSLVYMPSDVVATVDDWGGDHFGWEAFTLASPALKAAYVLASISSGKLFDELVSTYGLSCASVDHQSQGTICVSTPLQEAIVRRILKDPRTLILGGNDNGESHELSAIGQSFSIPSHWVERYDVLGNYWALFNMHDGTKIRIYANDIHSTDNDLPRLLRDGSSVRPSKAYAPELVDIKITDYCSRGCPFCYQGSTRVGKHADLRDISAIVGLLAKQQVFEVALGGGEPTEHPDFTTILTLFAAAGIQPNFTTRSKKLPQIIAKITQAYKTAGIHKSIVFAYSTETLKDIEHLEKLVEHNYYVRPTVQVIDGCITSEELSRVMQFCHKNQFNLTILGYKDAGFGARYQSNRVNSQWHETWMTVQTAAAFQTKSSEPSDKLLSLCVDTAMVQQYPDIFKKIPDVLFHGTEGKFSAYIDAVAGTFGPSSYCPVSDMVPMPKSSDEFLQAYAKF